jgi:hypothetical protein
MKTYLLSPTIVAFALLSFNVSAQPQVRYVNLNCTNPVPPYTGWSTAATNIQDAVSLAGPGDTVLVTNGVYQTGGWSSMGSNRVCVGIANLTVQSVNGPAVTVIKGYQVPGTTNGASAVRGVYLASGAVLSGFTVTGGATVNGNAPAGGIYCQSATSVITNCVVTGNASASYAGGVWYGTLNNCILSKNIAAYDGGGGYHSLLNNCLLITNSATNGGGAAYGYLTNCVLAGNSALSTGGGVYYAGSMDNCTIVGNFGGTGGGAYGNGTTLQNCIIYYNTAGGGGPLETNVYDFNLFMYNCCTTPSVGKGTGNITNPPAFVNPAGGDFHLQIGSPCINAGNNSFIANSTDLDGNPRIVGGTVDIGAYENQNTNTVHYVSLTSKNPVTPYTNWATAATNIQDAVASAQAGEYVVAGDGSYNAGGVVVYGSETNRVALTNGITLLGVYGPSSTFIVGGTQTRCVYVGSNSVLSGFTITNGVAWNEGDITNEQSGGGIWCETGGVVSHCLIIGNSSGVSYGRGGGIYGGTVYNSTLKGNSSPHGGGAASASLFNCIVISNALSNGNYGGGVYQGTLSNCTLTANWAYFGGGGAYQSTLYNCTVNGNSSGSGYGGGAYQSTNFNCLITGNTANSGGGTYQSTNFNCIISGNAALNGGGGAYGGLLYNCVLSGNTATNSIFSNGGGLYSATIINCTVTSNSASGVGGGMYGGNAFNSIIYFNSASGGANWTNYPVMYYCCTAPASFSGPGNITNNPAFVDVAGGDFRLQCGSPCIDAGFTNWFSPIGIISAPTNDIRGVARPMDGNGDGIAKFDMGAYEYNPAVDQTPVIRVAFTFANFTTGYAVSFAAEIGGCADYFWWDFGDGTTVTNQYNVNHAWTSPGTYTVLLTAYYSSLGYALSATTQVQVVQSPVYYADLNSPIPTSPYTNWMTAAHTIQQAIAAGTTPGRLVLVTNGTYRSIGVIVYGLMYNNLALTNPVVVQSVNGPGATTIQPFQGRCAYVGNNAILTGFTLTGGRTLTGGDVYNEQSGGGIWCEPGGVVSNCVVAGNFANLNGGGAYQGTFYNCLFTNNSVYAGGPVGGGGATCQSVLYDSCVVSNQAPRAGGCYGGMLSNCFVMNNRSFNGDGGGAYLSTLYNCTISGNYSPFNGGGGGSNTFWNCVLTGNQANYGGGAYASTLHNCLVASNQANNTGGGLFSGTLYNCTVANNTAISGGGVYANMPSTVYNSIIYGNTASSGGNNWQGGIFSYNGCSVPEMMPTDLTYGNITNDPIFVDAAFHLSAASPCRGAGSSLYATGTDLDGEAWNNPPSMGADEVYDADFVGALAVAIQSSRTSLLVNRSLSLTGQITGRAAGLEWSFGDGTIVTNVSYFTSHLWASAGDYSVVFTAYNADNPGGVSTNLLVHVLPLAQPWLQPASFSVSSTNGFQFQFNGQADAIYTVQVTTNLTPPIVWQDLQTITSTGGVVQVTDANATNVTSFYRVGVQ